MLLNANSVISRDGLIDALWGADPPRSAVQSLQVYVHGLRRAIGADRIETQGTGYELRLNPGELDVDRFEQLVERATRLPPPDAADDLRAALKLWNGAPLGDLGGERVAETEAPRLADRRLYAQERLHDAELALGRHDELLPELERLIVEEPYQGAVSGPVRARALPRRTPEGRTRGVSARTRDLRGGARSRPEPRAPGPGAPDLATRPFPHGP